MAPITRRMALAAAAASGLARPGLAQGKPSKLTFVGTNAGRFHSTFVEEVAPAFEKKHGIKVEFTLLPVDALGAKLRAELSAGSDAIDVIEWNPDMGPWLPPHLDDHEALLAAAADRNPAYDWNDFLPPVKQMARYDGRQVGIPYRVTTAVLFYQEPILEAAGIARPPQTFAEFRTAALAITKAGAPNRYGIGFAGRQGSAMLGGFSPFLLSAGGNFLDPATRDVLINRPEAVAALDFYSGLLTRDKVAAPEVTTWEFDEIIANAQNDRYGMAVTLSPYGSLVNDPALSKTAGRWGFEQAPGLDRIDQSRATLGGWSFSVSRYARHKEWAFEFIQMATSKDWLRRSMERGNAAPRTSVLMDPSVKASYPWAPVAAKALETAVELPRDPIWPTLDQRLRAGISQVLVGQATAKESLDAVAVDWQRSLRRAPAR